MVLTAHCHCTGRGGWSLPHWRNQSSPSLSSTPAPPPLLFPDSTRSMHPACSPRPLSPPCAGGRGEPFRDPKSSSTAPRTSPSQSMASAPATGAYGRQSPHAAGSLGHAGCACRLCFRSAACAACTCGAAISARSPTSRFSSGRSGSPAALHPSARSPDTTPEWLWCSAQCRGDQPALAAVSGCAAAPCGEPGVRAGVHRPSRQQPGPHRSQPRTAPRSCLGDQASSGLPARPHPATRFVLQEAMSGKQQTRGLLEPHSGFPSC
jgi:hypothetical protein